MPRAAGIYTVPPGTEGVSNATISSTAYNRFVHDIEQDQNDPRPISAGGTGGKTPAEALTNLGVPAAIQANVGFLNYVSSSQISFAPYGGDQVKINGKIYSIPTGGVIGNATDCYLNGAAHSTLTVGTTYYVYLFDNNGVLTIDYSTTAANISVQSGNAGVWKKIGDDTRSLIGMVRIAGGTVFLNNKTSRYVRSWFNRQGEDLSMAANFPAQKAITGTAIAAEADTSIRLSYLTWANEKVTMSFMSPGALDSAGVAGKFGFTTIAIDGLINITGNNFPYSILNGPPAALGGTFWSPIGYTLTVSTTDGWHQATVFAWNDVGTTMYLGLTGAGVFGCLNGSIHV